MTEQSFRQTPLFQINLLLWLSMPAKGDQIVPILWESGFRVYAIGASIRVPVDVQLKMHAPTGRTSIATSVSPDLLLQNKAKQALLAMECKLNSFGPCGPLSHRLSRPVSILVASPSRGMNL